MAGIISVETLRSERVELQPRTSDPSDTEEGEGWVRSDIAPETDQIATFRVDTGGSTIGVPVFASGTSQDDVVETIRLQVGGATGYIPAIPESKAGFPELRIQHNGQVYGYHSSNKGAAFFDVTIDGTNSPVNVFETLTVDYSVSNTGGPATQDIRLDVGSSERDRDNDVTVASGASTTGQLSWTSASQGDYTASVLSDDDSASTSVGVAGAIPDSGLLRYTMDSADTTSTTITDVWNGNDATNNGATTGASGANQTYDTADAVEFDSDGYIDGLGVDISGQSVSIALWAYPTSPAEWFSTSNLNTQFHSNSADELRFRVSGSDFRGSTVNKDEWHHVIGVIDSGNERRLYLNGNLDTTGSDTTINDTSYEIGGGNGYTGRVDDFRIYTNKALTESEASNLYNTGSIYG